jgi:hypothetical protein
LTDEARHPGPELGEQAAVRHDVVLEQGVVRAGHELAQLELAERHAALTVLRERRGPEERHYRPRHVHTTTVISPRYTSA